MIPFQPVLESGGFILNDKAEAIVSIKVGPFLNIKKKIQSGKLFFLLQVFTKQNSSQRTVVMSWKTEIISVRKLVFSFFLFFQTKPQISPRNRQKAFLKSVDIKGNTAQNPVFQTAKSFKLWYEV